MNRKTFIKSMGAGVAAIGLGGEISMAKDPETKGFRLKGLEVGIPRRTRSHDVDWNATNFRIDLLRRDGEILTVFGRTSGSFTIEGVEQNCEKLLIKEAKRWGFPIYE